ncbi:MAG TPA: hypothetical protein VGG14_13830 [Candidatus Sulfotelmatobacter sp.]
MDPTVSSPASRRRMLTTSPLSRNLEKNLLAYTAAAAALLAFAPSASAEIIYKPSNTPLGTPFAGGVNTPFDINGDGINDFTFDNYSYFSHGFGATDLSITAEQTGNGIVAVTLQGQDRPTAAALKAGVEVGPTQSFQAPRVLLGGIYEGSGGGAFGSWLNVETAYLGLKFVVNGETYYGWARIKFAGPDAVNSGSIYGYAYESVAGEPIVTGKTSGGAKQKVGQVKAADSHAVGTLAMLAAGKK